MRSKWQHTHGKRFRVYFINGKWMRRSRMVLAYKVNRPLRPDEDCHHINGDTTDDRPENLELMSHSEHAKYHMTLDRHHNWKGDEASAHAKYMREYIRRKPT